MITVTQLMPVRSDAARIVPSQLPGPKRDCMPDRPTLQHVRITALEINGRRIEIKSAELIHIQHWRGDEPAQREWEVAGRTPVQDLHQGTQSVVMTTDGKRLKGRVVLSSSSSFGLTAFEAVGLGDLAEV